MSDHLLGDEWERKSYMDHLELDNMVGEKGCLLPPAPLLGQTKALQSLGVKDRR